MVVGAGVAGLTLARALTLGGRSVKVLERAVHRVDRGLGLWGRSHVALRQLGLDALLDCPATTMRIPAAAYRSVSGEWLSRCTEMPLNRERVTTLRESALLQELENRLPEGTVERGVEVIDVRQSASGIELGLADGRSIAGSVVVGADGVRSAIRRLAFPEAAEAIDTGFVSHGGLLLSPSPGALDAIFPPATADEESPLAFETLSAGRRFAMVPLAAGSGFWFATRPMALGSTNEHADATGLRTLRAAYEGWHSPIPRALHAAACAAAEAAMGTPSADTTPQASPPPAAASHALHAACDAFRAERVLIAPPLGQWWRGRCVLVGDAAHALPINLAQGAAASIEGAYLLGQALGGSAPGEQPPDAAPGEAASCATWQTAFASYQAAHEPRVWQCRLASAFTTALAAPASAPTEALRNAMRFVPQPLNGYVFDAALEFSLGDIPSRTRAHWPLPTAAPGAPSRER